MPKSLFRTSSLDDLTFTPGFDKKAEMAFNLALENAGFNPDEYVIRITSDPAIHNTIGILIYHFQWVVWSESTTIGKGPIINQSYRDYEAVRFLKGVLDQMILDKLLA